MTAALAAVAVLGAAGSAQARVFLSRQATLTASGSVQISWHGDAARGCEAAGVCGYSGTVRIAPLADGQLQAEPGTREEHGDLTVASPVVRVSRSEGGAASGSCIDRLPIDAISLSLTPDRRGRLVPHFDSFFSAPAYRCAGPVIDVAFARLPARPVRRRTLDMRGTGSFADGPFAGQLESTLTARIGRVRTERTGDGGRTPRSSGRRRARFAVLEAEYRIRHLAGRARTAFGGLPGPQCLPFDSCGAHGALAYDFDVRHGFVYAFATVRAPRSARNPRRVLFAALRSGRARLGGNGDVFARATTSAEVARDGGATCRDSLSGVLPSIDVTGSRQIHVTLGGDQSGAPEGVFETRCPAPLGADMLGSSPLASGTIAVGTLGRRTLRMTLTGSGSYAGRGYSGTRSASVGLVLQRRSFHVVFQGGGGR